MLGGRFFLDTAYIYAMHVVSLLSLSRFLLAVSLTTKNQQGAKVDTFCLALLALALRPYESRTGCFQDNNT